MTDSGPSALDKQKSLKRLFPYILRYKLQAGMALVALCVASLSTLSLPMFVRGLVDEGLSADNLSNIDLYAGWLIVAVLVLALASASRYYFVIVLGERVVNDLRSDVFAKLTDLSPYFFDRNRSGDIVSRLTADATQIKSTVGATASLALRNLLLFVGAGVMMVVTSPAMSLLVLLAIPFVVLPLVGLGRWVRASQRRAQDRLAESSAYATEAIGSMRVLQSFTQEQTAKRYFSGAIEDAFLAARGSIRARAVLTAFGMFVVFASIITVLWYAAQDVANGHMTAGALSQFVIYSTLAAGGLAGMSEVWGEVSQASGAAERLFELLDEKSEIQSPANPKAIESEAGVGVAFDQVGFAYQAQGKADGERKSAPSILENLSFAIQPGETVAVVGPSGAGKSTLFQLIMRFYDVDQGAVSVCGHDVREVDLSDLRQTIAFVPQEPTIFATSIRDNIAMGHEGADQMMIEAAARAAHAHEFIVQLPEGYDTMIGERGVTLSGGQRQRLAIARAILKDAPLLLLDEATSALDAESERYVQTALDDLMEDRTTMVIAHRLATVQKADRILVLEGGRIVEEGTHDGLIAQKGRYARLASLQFGFEMDEVVSA